MTQTWLPGDTRLLIRDLIKDNHITQAVEKVPYAGEKSTGGLTAGWKAVIL